MSDEMAESLMSSSSYRLPDVAILNILSYLPIKDLAVACCVSKKWKGIARLDVIWKKFIPFPEFVTLENKSAYEMVSHMWRTSVKVGNERWYPNPLPDLVEFNKALRKAEYQQLAVDDNSTMTLMLRLNPSYQFAFKRKDENDTTASELCKMLWELFGYTDECALEITSHKDVLEKAKLLSKQEAMTSILKTLQPDWFLEELKIEEFELDEDGKISGGGNEKEKDSDDDDDDDDEEDDDYNSWKINFNKPLSKDVYQKMKAVFADKSEQFIEYYLSDGCFNENDPVAHSLVISDVAVYHIKQLYAL
jgi:hypothetical protein